jgi:hypothetical protein
LIIGSKGPNLNLDAPDLIEDMGGLAQAPAKKLTDFFRHLGLSHTVTPQHPSNSGAGETSTSASGTSASSVGPQPTTKIGMGGESCLVLSYTRRKLGERSALGGGPVLPQGRWSESGVFAWRTDSFGW